MRNAWHEEPRKDCHVSSRTKRSMATYQINPFNPILRKNSSLSSVLSTSSWDPKAVYLKSKFHQRNFSHNFRSDVNHHVNHSKSFSKKTTRVYPPVYWPTLFQRSGWILRRAAVIGLSTNLVNVMPPLHLRSTSEWRWNSGWPIGFLW